MTTHASQPYRRASRTTGLPRIALWLVALATAVGGLAVVSAPDSQAAAQADIDLDPNELLEDPLVGGGVEGYVQPSVPSQSWRVHAFAEVGDRLFVGGSFTTVTELPFAGATTHAQPFLAAFDLDTNHYIDTFTPVFDDVVWALAAHGDTLIVGGEFDTVNGVAREGLVKLDPITGAIVGQFDATIANDGSTYEASVRALEVVGDDLYVVGDYNRLVEGPWRHGRYRTARVDAVTGKVDSGWIPQVSGGGVFDVEIDSARSKVYLVGAFTSVGAQPDTRTGAVVDPGTGAVLAGHPMDLNGNWSRTYGVAVVDDKVFLGGEQHFLQVRSAVDWSWQGCMVTGYVGLDQSDCSADGWRGGSSYGGDYQVVENLDGWVFAGCHCHRDHWSTFTQLEIDLNDTGFRLYGADGVDHPFEGQATTWSEGPYATFADSNGCLYVGGDHTGNVDGFARFCRQVGAPTAVDAVVDGADIAITWTAPAQTGSGIEFYRVLRDGVEVGQSTTTSFTDTTVAIATEYDYSVIAQSTNEVQGTESDIDTVTSAGEDAAPPSTPGNVVLTTDGVSEVHITWDEATDDVGVTAYVIHRDWQYLGWTTDLEFTDDTVVAEQTYRYQVRAQDAVGNYSPASPLQSILVSNAGPDVTPPTTPGNVLLVTDGSGEVDVSWDASTDDVGVVGYLIHRDWQYLAYVTDLDHLDDTVVANETYRYQVRAKDAAGNISAPSPIQSILVAAGPDTTPPSTPTGAAAVVDGNGDVVLSWNAATDDVGVVGYLVHRDWQYLAYVSDLDHLDDTVVAGQTYRYQVRAQDAAGNNSAPTDFVFVTP